MADTTAAPNNREIVFRGRPQRERPRRSGFIGGDDNMPWDGPSFAARHNHSLSKGEASSAARQATAMVKAGVPDGIAIATANKRINKLRKRGVISDKQHARLADKYGGNDQQGIDAASR